MRVLITGANGFVGKALLDRLSADIENDCLGTVRSYPKGSPANQNIHVVKDISDSVAWGDLLSNRDIVIHTAGRAHVMREKNSDPLREYRQVNVIGTLNLARQAAVMGVQRFIFLSSIGVNGAINTRPFIESDNPNPVEPYAQSKWEAEQGLWNIQKETGLEIVIIRPPLVYGPNAPGNFFRLVRLVQKGWPLPLAAVHNKRSFIALDNLVDLILTCIDHPKAANQLYLAGDGEDLSTSDLLKGLATAMGRPCRLVSIPQNWLRLGATLVGKQELANRLLGSLQVDISKARDTLGWVPPLSVQEGLKLCFVSEIKN